jgi:hypothetical protein
MHLQSRWIALLGSFATVAALGAAAARAQTETSDPDKPAIKKPVAKKAAAKKPSEKKAISGLSDEMILERLTRARKTLSSLDGADEEQIDEIMAIREEAHQALRDVAAAFPVVVPSTEPGERKFVRILLNERKVGVDAIRLTAPEGGPWDLNWQYVFPFGENGGNIKSWYITGTAGPVRGFRTYTEENDVRIDGVDLPARNLSIEQSLPRGQLEAGKEYIIYFRFLNRETPTPLQVRMNLTPAPPKKRP